MPLSFFAIPMSTFLWKGRKQPFVYFSIMFYSYSAFHKQSMLSNFLVFHTLGGILSKLAAFFLLIFPHSFPAGYLWFQKCSWEDSWKDLSTSEVILLGWHLQVSWDAFPPLTSFTVCHASFDWLCSTEFLIWLIWHWIYSSCSFLFVLVLSRFLKVFMHCHLSA